MQGQAMPPELIHPEHFVHVRIIIGMVLGISISRLIVGVSEFIQHPKAKRIYPIHMGWVLYLFLTIIHFWWYEFSLVKVQVWSFPLYFFLILYTCVFAIMASLLFPSSLQEYRGFEDYFQTRRRSFYGIFVLIQIMDLIDTAIKGEAYFLSLGLEYPLQQTVFIVMGLIAMVVPSQRYQAALVVWTLLYKGLWIFRLYDILN
ncbi:hypothetical protein HC956_07820 [Alcaligenes faecalis]|uniref:Uncharacterized protein n=2 Tax=Alcaligenes TaxID=507 RepID=A0ABX8SSC2_9BURK|nr:hypothetical protein FE795_07825 [Alcaligenes ammonioxydans]